MTGSIVKRTGRLLFPHLARDQRKRQITIILLVLATSLLTAGLLVAWIWYSRH